MTVIGRTRDSHEDLPGLNDAAVAAEVRGDHVARADKTDRSESLTQTDRSGFHTGVFA